MVSAAEEKFIFCGGKPFLPQGKEGVTGRLACCFTGHRPDKMPSGEKLRELRLRVQTSAEVLMNKGVDTFIIGMAPGFDLARKRIRRRKAHMRSALQDPPYLSGGGFGSAQDIRGSPRKMRGSALLLRELRETVL